MINVDEARRIIADLSGAERVVSEGGPFVELNGRVGLGSASFEQSPDFERQLCKILKVPQGFLKKCSPALRSHIISEFSSGEERFKLIIRNDLADSIMSHSDMFIPVQSMFDRTVEVLGANIMFDHVSKRDGEFDFDVVIMDRVTEPKPGDVCYAGINVRAGQIGDLNYRVSVGIYGYRLVCQNGLMHRDSYNDFVFKKFGTEAELIESFSTLIAQTANQCHARFMQDYSRSSSANISDPACFLRAVMKNSDLPAELEEIVLDQVTTLPAQPTLYDVVNMVTLQANTYTWARRKLLELGGRIVNNTVPICDQCNKVLLAM